MSVSQLAALSQSEQEQFSAMVERMRQLRRRSGVPDGVTVEEAVNLHIISGEDLERARWGDLAPPAPPAPPAPEPTMSRGNTAIPVL